jgi:hypothetical protein
MALGRIRERVTERLKLTAARRGYLLSRYSGAGGTEQRRQWMKSALAVKAERPLLMDPGEACQLISLVLATRHISGELAELGVGYGASARLIAEYAHGRTLHLFDTFRGLPDPGEGDSKKFQPGDFRSSLSDVQSYLEGFHVEYHPGLFPETAAAVRPRTFAFVHLDLDLYEGTVSALREFYPRMSAGGIILLHDYLSSAGVTRAFQEFFQDKPEPILELSGYQAMVVKLASRHDGPSQ